MQPKLSQFVDIVMQDPAVDNANGFVGRRQHEHRRACSSRSSRSSSARSPPTRSSRACAPKLAHVPGATLLPAARPGPAHRRPRRRRPVPVHAAGRRLRRALRLGAARARRRCAKLPELADVNSDQQNKGLQASLVDRPRDRLAPGHHAAGDRRHALRRVRPAPGLDDVHAAEPVPRRHGGRAGVLAEPRRPASTSTCAPRPATSCRSRAFTRYAPVDGAARRQPPGPVPVGHDLLQPAAPASRSATPSTRSSRAEAEMRAARRRSAAASRARRRRSRPRSPTSRS